ncbi:MAG: vanadium-dependent haloperoxidase [Planctomycetota bacterium]
MEVRRIGARPRQCERLEDRQMLAADLGAELSSFTDLGSEVAEVASVDSTGSGSGEAASLASMTNQLHAESGDVVLGWNNLFNELLVADEVNQNPGYASRSMAMMNLAIYDAVTLATGDAEDAFYEYSNAIVNSDSRLDVELVASHAAHRVLSGLYPDQQAEVDSFLASVLEGTSENRSTAASVALGMEIGNTVLAARANDGSGAVVDYTYTEGVGSFQADPLNPDVPVWGPGWGEVETFSISAAEDFAPETTPPITSEEYADSYNEVKELGSVDSETRTADQTEAGIFWAYDRVGLGTPLSLFNDVLETIALQEGNTLQENAALYAQASVAMADAAIVAWHTKFDEEFWRPVTAIHDGDVDGNPLTEGDPDWTALGAPDGEGDIIGFTPQFPTYISGHATFGGALFGAIQEFYGTDDIAFELNSRELEILLEDPELQAEYGLELDDASRSFDSLSEAMAENGRSRVYLGIHFDFDDLVGQEVGQAVASAVSSEFVVASEDRGKGGEGHGPRQAEKHVRRHSGLGAPGSMGQIPMPGKNDDATPSGPVGERWVQVPGAGMQLDDGGGPGGRPGSAARAQRGAPGPEGRTMRAVHSDAAGEEAMRPATAGFVNAQLTGFGANPAAPSQGPAVDQEAMAGSDGAGVNRQPHADPVRADLPQRPMGRGQHEDSAEAADNYFAELGEPDLPPLMDPQRAAQGRLGGRPGPVPRT